MSVYDHASRRPRFGNPYPRFRFFVKSGQHGVPVQQEGVFQVRQSYVPLRQSMCVLKTDEHAVGHIAENCSSEQRLCYNCRQPGHESAACPSPRSVAAKQCYSCGGVGHIQAECPSLRLQNSGSKCYVSTFDRDPVAFGSQREYIRAAVGLVTSRAPARAALEALSPPAPRPRDVP
ncbi:hypothetical protein GY45DRAFT_856337 [Cubamyces sp. BRFM 1775]|nr:hypothetical protein GY45DRAFT_856337 [Cubamyces sp. BRFM 1775]